MYENDYSWVPSFFGGLMVLAALGGVTISFIRRDPVRSGMLKAWLSVPVLLSVLLAGVAALFGKGLETYSVVLFVPIFAVIFSPPWLIAACAAYAFRRFIRAKTVSEEPNE